MEHALASLGFVRYRNVTKEVCLRFHEEVGHSLPEVYREFLSWREPPKMPLLYHFDQSEDTVESCVSEFHNIAPHADDLFDLAKQIVASDGHKWLPVACDPGGNWLCLHLESGAVCDLEYGTGRWSQVAPDFAAFVSTLKPEDD